MSGAAAGQLEETYVQPDTAEVRSVRVQYLSGDITTDEGRVDLQRRISIAAKSVCGPLGARAAGGLRMASRNKRCYDEAVQAALSQIGHRQIAASGQ
jgi:UrcA family protein